MENLETNHSDNIGKLFEALSKAQGKIESALKDKKNPFFKSSYADLTSVWEACRPALSENGLAIIQTVEGTKQDMFLITWLGHSSGEWMKSRLPLIVMKADPQALGSAITYARRYALSAMVGVCADEDDDGEKAMNRNESKNQSKVFSISNPEEDERSLSELYKEFPDEDPSIIRAYLDKYSSHWKKSITKAIQDYSNRDVLVKDLAKWKKKATA